jgi:hypothetical protein
MKNIEEYILNIHSSPWFWFWLARTFQTLIISSSTSESDFTTKGILKFLDDLVNPNSTDW